MCIPVHPMSVVLEPPTKRCTPSPQPPRDPGEPAPSPASSQFQPLSPGRPLQSEGPDTWCTERAACNGSRRMGGDLTRRGSRTIVQYMPASRSVCGVLCCICRGIRGWHLASGASGRITVVRASLDLASTVYMWHHQNVYPLCSNCTDLAPSFPTHLQASSSTVF